MISFRHHIVSLTAVFLALAVGVVLGGGPLSDVGRDDEPAPSSVRQDDDTALRAELGDTFAGAAAPGLYDDRLADRSVNLVTLPGADPDVTRGLTEQIAAAGGAVNATYAVQETLVDPSEKSLVDTLGSQLMTQVGGDVVTADATTYDRLGQLLAYATTTTEPAGDEVVAKASSVMESLMGAGLIGAADEISRRAPLVLLVLGNGAETQDVETAAAQDAILAGLIDGLSAGAAGVVVTGDSVSGADGQLARLREDPVMSEVSGIDGIEGTVGQVIGILALISAGAGTTGQFGASGADGAPPLG